MPCCGDREKLGQLKSEETWDYINLGDFKNSSCFTAFSYGMVWVFLVLSVAFYGVDTFTAVNLLAFSRWAGQIEPSIPLRISRWIFAGCIILSFVLLFFRWVRTIRVIRSGSIAESYLDPLAVRVQTIRLGSRGRGWKRFLVFAELTKSKKGADYVALFSYYSFEAWLRIIFADGPRQVVNAITLYSVMQLSLIPEGKNAAAPGTSPVVQFFINIKALAEKNDMQAAILFGMLFTLIIWVFSMLSLALSVVLYLIFLWHHIPSEDGSLKRYCRRKINTRLTRIVMRKTNKALAREGVALQDRKPTMPLSEGEELRTVKTAPTLPSVADLEDDKKAAITATVTPLSRQTTQTTLPPYTARPDTAGPDEGSQRLPTLPNLDDDDRPLLTRTDTQNSAYSASNSLLGHAGAMGYSPLDRNHSPAPPMPPIPLNSLQGPFDASVSRPPTAQSRLPLGPMPMEGPGRRTPGTEYPPTHRGYPQPPPQLMGRRTPGMPPGRFPPDREFSPADNMPGRSLTPLNANVPWSSRDPVQRTNTPTRSTASPRPPNNGAYVAFNPNMAASSSGETRSQTPVAVMHSNIARPSTTTPSRDGVHRAIPTDYVRPSTTTPSNGYRRQLSSNQALSQPSRNGPLPAEEEEYDPFSYYGSAH